MEMREPGGVVLDKSLLMALIVTQQLHMLPGYSKIAVATPEEVRNELSSFDRAVVDHAVRQERLAYESPTGAKAVSLYSRLKGTLARHEAATVALASTRGWLLAANDQDWLTFEALGMLGQNGVTNFNGLHFVIARTRGQTQGA